VRRIMCIARSKHRNGPWRRLRMSKLSIRYKHLTCFRFRGQAQTAS
jgi:hypothetical protein